MRMVGVSEYSVQMRLEAAHGASCFWIFEVCAFTCRNVDLETFLKLNQGLSGCFDGESAMVTRGLLL
jgi:hypothetical protein